MKRLTIVAIVAILLAGAWFSFHSDSKNVAQDTPASRSSDTATAILAGGCFWCVEHDMLQLPGVMNAVSGYSGGDRPNPTYENYHTLTNEYRIPHLEVVEVTYDSSKLSYEQLLEYFFQHIDPTDGGGQFCDRGPAYRPAVFVANDRERVIAEKLKAKVAETLGSEDKTEILDAKKFWRAEDYHQRYAEKNPSQYKFYRWNCGRDQTVEKLWKGHSF